MTKIIITENMFASIRRIANHNRWSESKVLPKLIKYELVRVESDKCVSPDKRLIVVKNCKDLYFSKITEISFNREILHKTDWKSALREIIMIAYNKHFVERERFKDFLLRNKFTSGIDKEKGKTPIHELGISAPSLNAPTIGSLIQKLSEFCGNVSFDIRLRWGDSKDCPPEKRRRSGIFSSGYTEK